MILNIKEAARERGLTLAVIARKLGIHRSNMSAIASGSRGASLKILKKLSRILGLNLDELVNSKNELIFKNKKAKHALEIIEKENYDGINKSWVDKVMLAQKIHYGKARRAA